MATTKPRITISLEPRVYDLIGRVARASGESMSQVVTGFLDVAVPPMERMVVLLEQAVSAPEEARGDIAASLRRAEARLLPDLVNAIDQADMFVARELADIEKAERARQQGAERRRQAASKAPPGLTTPVPVTRGSGRRKAPGKVPTKGGA